MYSSPQSHSCAPKETTRTKLLSKFISSNTSNSLHIIHSEVSKTILRARLLPNTAEARNEGIASEHIRGASPFWHSVDDPGSFADSLAMQRAIDEGVENNRATTPSTFEHGSEEGETEVDPIHAGATVDEDAVSDMGRRDTSGPIHSVLKT